MRQPITKASFAPHVQSWSYEEFKARFESQMTIEEIEYFAKELGILKEEAPKEEAPKEGRTAKILPTKEKD